MHLIRVSVSPSSVQRIQALVAKRVGVVPLDSGMPNAHVNLVTKRVEEAFSGDSRGTILGRDLDDVGCVLFTSGSTGRPKGVVYDWGLIDWLVTDSLQQLARGDSEARTVMFSSPAYNAGFLRALLPLAGPQVFPIDPATTEPGEILRQLEKEKVNQISFVPALIDSLHEAAQKKKIRLRAVNTAYVFGEKVTWARIAKVRDLIHPDATIVVRYAATEAPGGILNFAIPPGMPLGEGIVPLGVPTSPGRVRLVPLGDDSGVNQIAVREPIALGYMDDDDYTAARFITDADGVRWWLSGDLARVDEDGVFHFLGRSDDLVKIRGHLVDPGVSEKALLGIEGIDAAVVLPQDDPHGDPRLVAHLVLRDGGELTPAVIFQRLFEVVPREHLPSMLVRHTRLPLTARGKVDRVRLQNSEWERWRSATQQSSTPRLGGVVLRLLREILQRPDLGWDEDTWAAGMDSLLALEFVTKVRELGYGDFPPTLLLELRSAKKLTDFLHSSPDFTAQTCVTLNPQGTQAPVFCIPGAGATALSFRSFATELGADHPVVVVEPRGMHTEGSIDLSLEGFAANAVSDMSPFIQGTEVLIVGHSAGGQIAYEMGYQLRKAGYYPRVVFLDSTQLFNTPLPSEEGWRWEEFRLRVVALRLFVERNILKVVNPRALAPRTEGTRSQMGRNYKRYRTIRRVMENASAVYRTKPVDFPMLLLRCGPDRRPHITSSYHTLQQIQVDGNHWTLLQPPFVQAVARHTREFLFSLPENQS